MSRSQKARARSKRRSEAHSQAAPPPSDLEQLLADWCLDCFGREAECGHFEVGMSENWLPADEYEFLPRSAKPPAGHEWTPVTVMSASGESREVVVSRKSPPKPGKGGGEQLRLW